MMQQSWKSCRFLRFALSICNRLHEKSTRYHLIHPAICRRLIGSYPHWMLAHQPQHSIWRMCSQKWRISSHTATTSSAQVPSSFQFEAFEPEHVRLEACFRYCAYWRFLSRSKSEASELDFAYAQARRFSASFCCSGCARPLLDLCC